jgi:hypothetical protein
VTHIFFKILTWSDLLIHIEGLLLHLYLSIIFLKRELPGCSNWISGCRAKLLNGNTCPEWWKRWWKKYSHSSPNVFHDALGARLWNLTICWDSTHVVLLLHNWITVFSGFRVFAQFTVLLWYITRTFDGVLYRRSIHGVAAVKVIYLDTSGISGSVYTWPTSSSICTYNLLCRSRTSPVHVPHPRGRSPPDGSQGGNKRKCGPGTNQCYFHSLSTEHCLI